MSNPRGQQRDKPFRDALRMEIASAQDENDFRSLRRIAKKLLEMAGEGDVVAIKEVGDRLDGRVAQHVEVGEPGDFDHMDDSELAAMIATEAKELQITFPKRRTNGSGNGTSH